MACERAFPKVIGALAILLLVTCSPAEVAAQDTGCLLQPTGIPPRQVIRCRGGLTVEAAAGSDYTLVDHGRDGIPDSAILRGGALLVNAPEQSGKRAFQIHTPQAIAAVRGTEWAVRRGRGEDGRVRCERSRLRSPPAGATRELATGRGGRCRTGHGAAAGETLVGRARSIPAWSVSDGEPTLPGRQHLATFLAAAFAALWGIVLGGPALARRHLAARPARRAPDRPALFSPGGKTRTRLDHHHRH